MVLITVLLEKGTSHDLAGGVGGAIGMEGLIAEVHFHAVSLQYHIAVIYLAIAVEESATRGEVHGHRVAGLVFDQLVDSIGRDTHQRVDISLSGDSMSRQQHKRQRKEGGKKADTMLFTMRQNI